MTAKSTPTSSLPPRSAPKRAALSAFQTRPSQLTGAVLGERYKIFGTLSQGSAARVYLAEDSTSGAPVVVKMLSPEASRNPELRARIAREAQASTTVHHPNVVDVLGLGETPGGLPYLVLEALPGEPLDEVLRKRGKLPEDLALVLARQIATGLHATHAAGIVHGDVNPKNLMVLGAPEHPYGVKVLDYGLAKLWDAGATSGTHSVVGSAEFLSPEQIVGEAATPQSDLYSLGIILFRMVTGQLPFDTAAGPLILRHHLFSKTPPPSWLDEALDPRLEAVILNATRKHPRNRYPSMLALLADLDAIVGLSSKAVQLSPLEVSPDEYLPVTEHGREAISVLAQKFGSWLPPSAERTPR